MEQSNNFASEQLLEEYKRPEMLKVLCILSFIMAGLELIVFSLGIMALSLSPDQIEQAWGMYVEKQPELAKYDAVAFFHATGMYCLYFVIATVFSLLGLIMMWRMERAGIFIYTIAELGTHLIPFEMTMEESGGNAGTIFMVLLDLLFIALYFTQLKYFKKKA